ncbi:MAG: toxin-antitoxin system YwqK family antitoxin [Bacteroidales bacterium]
MITRLLILLSVVFIFACKPKPPHENVESTYPDGSAQLIKYYKNEAMEELVKEVHYFENGEKRMEGAYKNGERHGEWTAWYENGNIWSTGHYKLGKENGLKTVWHKNGVKYYEGEVVDDQRTGVWRFWNEQGELLKEVDYSK